MVCLPFSNQLNRLFYCHKLPFYPEFVVRNLLFSFVKFGQLGSFVLFAPIVQHFLNSDILKRICIFGMQVLRLLARNRKLAWWLPDFDLGTWTESILS